MLSRALPVAWHGQCTGTSLHSCLQQQYCRLQQKSRWDWDRLSSASNMIVAAASSSSSTSFEGSATARPPAGQVGSAGRRRRRKLFTDPDSSQEDASSRFKAEPASVEVEPQRTHTPDYSASVDRGSSAQEDVQEQQQQPGWLSHALAASQPSLYVFWDLDNLKPQHWDQAGDVVKNLEAVLEPCGKLRSMQAYANSRTLVREVEMDGLEDVIEADELRCPICNRLHKSLRDLQKHFRQLHEREHQKRLRGTKNYAKSDKAARVRDAARLFGTPKKNRAGRRGQLVKVVLKRAGVKCIEVGSQRQAADDAINRHLDGLMTQLAASEALQPSTAAAAVAAKAAAAAAAAQSGHDGGQDPYAAALQANLSSLPNAQACLQQMTEMSEYDLRLAWKYLRCFPEGKAANRRSKLWRKLEKARERSTKEAPEVPEWLDMAWNAFHERQQQQQQQQQQQMPPPQQELQLQELNQQQRPVAALEAAAEAAGLPPWDNSTTALQQAVLVIVSDDRGFARSVARWLMRGAAGAVVVTTRSAASWQKPLAAAACPRNRRADVVFSNWDEVVADLHSGRGGDSQSDWEDSDDVYEGQDPYQWMISQGLM